MVVSPGSIRSYVSRRISRPGGPYISGKGRPAIARSLLPLKPLSSECRHVELYFPLPFTVSPYGSLTSHPPRFDAQLASAGYWRSTTSTCISLGAMRRAMTPLYPCRTPPLTLYSLCLQHVQLPKTSHPRRPI